MLLRGLEKAKGTLRRGTAMAPREEQPSIPKLDDLGVTKKQSATWQPGQRTDALLLLHRGFASVL